MRWRLHGGDAACTAGRWTLFSLMEFLIVGLVLLAVITVVGHGIWIGLAKLFDRSPPEIAPRRCPRCGLALLGDTCSVCFWPQPLVQRPNTREALEHLAAQVARLEQLAIIDGHARAKFDAVIDSERRGESRPAQPAQTKSAAPPLIEVPQPISPRPPIEAPPIATDSIVEAILIEPTAPAIEPRQTTERTPEERVAAFVARHSGTERSTADDPRERAFAAPPVTAPPVVPRKNWSDWLAGFMEERNIRWGELVGGLLIVCSSIALVISFWSAIEARPWLKFLLFNGVTAATFGAGFYCERRLRLPTTAQGLLTIGTLLVPLNFLAIAALSSAPDAGNVVTILAEGLSAALFAALVYFAAGVLVRCDTWLFTVGVMAPALTNLLVRRFIDPAATLPTLAAVAAAPAASYLLTNLWHLRRMQQEAAPEEAEVNALFKFLGITSFATLLPLALLAYKTGHPILALRQLPLVAAIVGFVPLSAGLTLWQRLADRNLSALRTAGTAVAILGAAVSLTGLVIGWPEPSALIPAAIAEFAILTYLGWRYRLPALHLPAAFCLAAVGLIGAYLIQGRLAWSGVSSQQMLDAIASGESGVLLAPLVVLYAGLAAVFARRGSDATSALAGAAAVMMVASVATLLRFGYGDAGVPLGAGWIYLLYAGGLIGWSARSSWHTPAWAGLALLLGASWQLVVFQLGPSFGWVRAWFDALLIFSSVVTAIGLLLPRVVLAESKLPRAALQAAIAVSLAAVAATLLPMPFLAGWLAWRLLWVAVLWSVLAVALDRAYLGTLAQLALAAAAVLAVGSAMQQQAWYQTALRPWIDPRMLQAAGLALTAVNLAWIVLRAAAARFEETSTEFLARAARMLHSPALIVDRVTTAVLVALVVLLATAAVLPGTALEITPANEIPPTFAESWVDLGFDPALAGQMGTWLLAAALAGLLLATLRQSPDRGWLYAEVLTVATFVPLVASRFAATDAAASALVWSSVLFLLLASVGVWCRGPVARAASALGFDIWSSESGVCRDTTILVLLIGLFAPLAIGATICLQALDGSAIMLQQIPFYLVAAIVMAMAASLMWAVESRESAAGTSARANLPLATPALALLLGVVPLVGIVLYQLATAVAASPIRGPDPASVFARLDAPLAWGVPVALVAVALLGYALRERSSRFALAAGLVTCLTVCVMWLLASSSLIGEIGTWIRLAQLAATAAALFTLCWIWLVAWDRRSEGRYGFLVGGPLFDVQSMVAPAIAAILVGWTWLRLVWRPVPPFGAIVPFEFSDPFGILSLGLVVAAVCLTAAALARPLSRLALSSLLVTLATILAGVVARWDTGNWLAFRTLYLSHMAIAVVLLVFAWRERKEVGEGLLPGQFWPALQAGLLFLLAVQLFGDWPWWAIAGWALIGVGLAPATAIFYERRRYLYLASVVANIAGLAAADQFGLVPDFREFLYWNIGLAALLVPAWLLIELRVIDRRALPAKNVLPAHRTLAWLATLTLTLTVAGELAGDVAGGLPLPVIGVNWLALGAVVVAAGSLLWDVRAREAMGLLYGLGLVACGMTLDVLNLTPPWLMWTGGMLIAAYAVATSTLWTFRAGLAGLAGALRIPQRNAEQHGDLVWLVPANLLLVASVMVLALGVLLTSHRVDLRVLIAQAALAQVASLALLARGERRDALQHAALTVGAIGAVYFGWAWLIPGDTFSLLHALIVVAAATVAVAAFYGLGLVKLLGTASPWLSAARRLLPPLVAIGVLAILGSLVSELGQFVTRGEVQTALFASLLLGTTMVVLMLAALAAAILPGRDPLALSERGRTAYVYSAEILLALLFVHIRVTFPWLFSGLLQQYWPLIVMAIAFLGVGAGELFRRRQVNVLAGPLENTGVMLPVLPVLGFWFVESQVDYSLLLLGVGLLYASLSIARRSFGFGVLAALAANGGLWFFLGQQEGWGFLAHPQVWLIPPAVCVLVAAYLNRGQLNDAQMTATRYASSMAIYLSSTAEIFLNGVAQAPWLPVVLAGLSVLGILAGILLRVRAFLLLGTGFLALALFTVIWYAAVDLEQTWIWFACLGVLGVLILVLFAFFEKRRQDVLAVVERLKQWEA